MHLEYKTIFKENEEKVGHPYVGSVDYVSKKNSFVFFEKSSSSFFKDLMAEKKLRILIEDLTHIIIKKHITFTMGRRFDDGKWSRFCG